MIGLYQMLDLAATINEACVLLVIVKCFCKCHRAKIIQMLPLLSHVIFTYFLTWNTSLGEYKSFVIILFDIAVFWFCFKDSLIKIGIGVIFSIIIILLSEPATYLIAEFLSIRLDFRIDGMLFPYWPVYLIVMLVRGILCLLARYFMKGFVYELKFRDFLPVLLDFIVIEAVYLHYYDKFFSGDASYFNKTWGLIFIAAGIVFLIHFLYTKNYFALKSMKEHDEYIIDQMEKQHTYYQEKLKEEERVRSIYHDLKNHLLLLEASASDSGTVKQMIDSLKIQFSDYENYQHTGNDFLDIILREKGRVCKEKQIDFSAVCHFEGGSFINPLDISSIFGNALDNAIEASEKLSPEKRLITVKAAQVQEMISIMFENNTVETASSYTKTTKQDTFLHGLGIANIKKSVEKYQGECTIHQTDGRFVMKIIIPISEGAS